MGASLISFYIYLNLSIKSPFLAVKRPNPIQSCEQIKTPAFCIQQFASIGVTTCKLLYSIRHWNPAPFLWGGGNPSVAGIVTRVVWFSRFLVLWGSRIRRLSKAPWLVNCFHSHRDIFSPILMNDKRGMLTEEKSRALVHLSAEKGVEFSLTRWTTTHDSRDRFTEVAQNSPCSPRV